MAKDFEKLVNEKIEGASLKDVMPDFDKEAMWNELDNRLPVPAGRKVLPLWWTHTATVAAGILLGVVLIRSLYGGGIDDNAATTAVKQDAAPVVVVKRDTVFVPVEPSGPTKGPIVENKQPGPHQQVPVQQQIAVETLQEPTRQPVAEKTMEQQPIAQSKPKKIKAVHLLDIDNENRQAALYHNDANAHHRTGFALQISTQRLPVNNPQQRQETLIKELLK